MLITSRDARVGLNAIPGAPDDLALLDTADAVALLRARLLDLSASDVQAAEISRLVGGLPLALVLAGGFIVRRLRRDPDPVETYLALLQRTPLAVLEMGDRRDTSVRVAFDLSWQHLDDTPRRALAALALIPGDSAAATPLSLPPWERRLTRVHYNGRSGPRPTFRSSNEKQTAPARTLSCAPTPANNLRRSKPSRSAGACSVTIWPMHSSTRSAPTSPTALHWKPSATTSSARWPGPGMIKTGVR